MNRRKSRKNRKRVAIYNRLNNNMNKKYNRLKNNMKNRQSRLDRITNRKYK